MFRCEIHFAKKENGYTNTDWRNKNTVRLTTSEALPLEALPWEVREEFKVDGRRQTVYHYPLGNPTRDEYRLVFKKVR